MAKFTKVSEIGIQCNYCGVLLPMVDKDKHQCEPAKIFAYAKEKYELEDITKNKKEVIVESEHKEKQVVTIQSSIVMPAVSPEEAVKRWKEYQDLKKKIVEKEDEQEISGKSFLKKSYWRKLATFFNLSVEIVEEKSEILNRLGKEVIVYHFRARATAPNGRFAEGTGSCDIYDHATIHEGKFCVWDKFKKEWKEAEEKSLHNTRTTAETRAWNRAVSNLVGGGEVSAEEIKEENNGSTEHKEKSQPVPKGVLTISEALKQPVNSTFDCQGILSDFKEEKVGKDKKDITRYTILSEDSSCGMKISKWGKIVDNVRVGDTIQFILIKTTEYNKEKQYLASSIDLVKTFEEE